MEGTLQYRSYRDKQNRDQRVAVVVVNRSGMCRSHRVHRLGPYGQQQTRRVGGGGDAGGLDGARLLDAGCGTGALSVIAAQRGAHVTAVDVAANLVDLARERAPLDLGAGLIDFHVGDMLDPAFGTFDHVVAMDSLIHYSTAEIVGFLEGMAPRTRRSIVLTFAPQTPALATMHFVGRLFPRGDRAPEILPVSPARLIRAIAASPGLKDWAAVRTERIVSGFYTSQALELVRV